MYDKTKARGRIKEHKRDINLNKSTTAMTLNNKSPITIDFNNVEKLAAYGYKEGHRNYHS